MNRCTLIAVMLSSLSLVAQEGSSPARVEIISIKSTPGPTSDPRRLTCGLPNVERTAGRIYVRFSQVCGLILVRYEVADYQVAGIPVGAGVGPTDFFEVEVRLDGGGVPTMENTRAVIRSMLAERFKLRIRRETQEQPIFVLTVSENGPKPSPCSDPNAPSAYVRGHIRSCSPPIPMSRLLQFFSNETGRPVLDKTGLPALTFELRWALPTAEALPPGSPPEFFTAVREQLGLKLEPQRGPVEMIVVDSVAPPIPN